MSFPLARTAGFCAAAGPLVLSGLVASWGDAWTAVPAGSLAAAGAAGGAVSLGGLLLLRLPAAGRWLLTAGAVGMPVALAALLRERPSLALAVLLAATGLVCGLWVWPGMSARGRGPDPGSGYGARARARSAAAAALGGWAVAVTVSRDPGPPALTAVAGSFAIAVGLALRWALAARREHPLRARALLGTAVSAAVLAGTLFARPRLAVAAGALPVLSVLLVLPSAAPRRGTFARRAGSLEAFFAHPSRLLVSTFLGLCLAGGAALSLPVCSAPGRVLAAQDVAFTAVSAVCVTGLVVVDTAEAWSVVGQVVLLVLIQLGGLGIMAFATSAVHLLGHRMSLRYEGAVASLLSGEHRGRLRASIRQVLLLTFAAEAVGTVLLTGLFRLQGDPPLGALGRGVFTAVSAFCNAGFALQTESLAPYRESTAVLHVVAALVVLGGLSPAVVLALPSLLRRRPGGTGARIAIVSSAALLVFGALGFAVMEWEGVLGDVSAFDRLHNAWFHSVTLRTAGFDAVDVSGVRPATLSLMMVWMFIGGSPGGTAGGIKTTTACVLLLAVLAAIRGRKRISVFGRCVPHRTVYEAAAIVTLGAAVFFVTLTALQLTQDMPSRAAVFETVSALGTVGLTVGGTDLLDGVGKSIIMVAMFLGRVGPLTVFLFLAERRDQEPWWRPEEALDVG